MPRTVLRGGTPRLTYDELVGGTTDELDIGAKEVVERVTATVVGMVLEESGSLDSGAYVGLVIDVVTVTGTKTVTKPDAIAGVGLGSEGDIDVDLATDTSLVGSIYANLALIEMGGLGILTLDGSINGRIGGKMERELFEGF